MFLDAQDQFTVMSILFWLPQAVRKKYNIGNRVYTMPKFAEITKGGYGNNGRSDSQASPNIPIPHHIREKTEFPSQKTKGITSGIGTRI